MQLKRRRQKPTEERQFFMKEITKKNTNIFKILCSTTKTDNINMKLEKSENSILESVQKALLCKVGVWQMYILCMGWNLHGEGLLLQRLLPLVFLDCTLTLH